MGLFGSDDDKKTSKKPVLSKPVDPGWVLDSKGKFLSFLYLDPEELNLNGVGGVYLIWHAGVRPEWVYAGLTNDMASALHDAGENADINYYEANGGLYVSWAPIKADFRKGVVKYIEENFITLVSNSSCYDDNTRIVPVKPPSTKSAKKK